MGKQTFLFVQAVRERLRITARRISLAVLLRGLLITTGILCTTWIVLVALEAGFWLDIKPRAAFFWMFIVLTIGLFVFYLVLPALRTLGLIKGPSDEALARQIGNRFPEISDRLVNLLQLAEGRSSTAPEELVDRAVEILGNQISEVPFETLEDFKRVQYTGRLVTVPVLGLFIFLLAAPSMFLNASIRLLSPRTFFQRPAPFELSIEPGSIELARNANLDIVIRAEGEYQPRTVTLALNNLDETLVEEFELSSDSAGSFKYTLVNVRRSFRYRAEADPVESTWYFATVVERPIVRGLQIALQYPGYTRIPPQRLEANVGDITALRGTRVDLQVRLGGSDIEEAYLLFNDGTIDSLDIGDTTARGFFHLTKDGGYQIILKNNQGLENADPIQYGIRLVPDAFPSITLLEPEADTVLNDNLRVDLHYRIHDDFGFSDLSLFYRLAESQYGAVTPDYETAPIPVFDLSQLDQESVYLWLLFDETGLDPLPGDVIEYYLQVKDNDSVAGYKRATTPTYRLRLPTLTEQYEMLDEDQDIVEENLEEILRQTDELRSQFEEVRDELRNKTEADWEDERQVDQLQEKQEQLEEQVKALNEQLDSINEQMEDNHLISEETLEMYHELQKVFEEINSPELEEALRQLQQAVEELNLQKLQEGLQQFDFNEQQFRDRLERALELFKNLRTQQKLEALENRIEALAEIQEMLQEETLKTEEKLLQDTENAGEENEQEERPENGDVDENREPSGESESDNDQGHSEEDRAEELADEQERSSEEMTDIQEEMQSLIDQMQEMQQAPSEQMERLTEQVKQQQIPEEMQKNAEELRQNQFQDATKGQQQIQQQLESLQSQLQDMRQQMQGQQLQINMAGIRRVLSDILTLSHDQEDLRVLVSDISSELLAMREEAQKQVELSEGLRVVADSLQSLSRDIPQMSNQVQQQAGNAMRAMSDAIGSMTDRAVNETSAHQKTAMMHLNELALLLSDLLNQLMNMANGTGGTSGMTMEQIIQQLQQMAGQQEQLNSQIQQFLNDLQGNRLSGDMEERLRQMAAQQEAIKRQLRQLNREPDARGQLLGDLNKIAEQMEETIRELQVRQVSRPMVNRQQQILTRLLDAQRSLHERGQERLRQGRTVDDILRQGPGELTPSEASERLRRELLRALESGYAPDFEELIKRYFELLQQQEVGE